MDDNIFRLQQLLIEHPEMHASQVLELWVTEMKEAHEKQLASMQAFRADNDSQAFYSLAEIQKHQGDDKYAIVRYHSVLVKDMHVWAKINGVKASDAIAVATGQVGRVGNFIQGSMRRGAIGRRYDGGREVRENAETKMPILR